MVALVGYTGFVGSNIYARARNRVDGVFNSKNIEKAYGLDPEVLIYTGLPAVKYHADREPFRDLEMILEAEKNIKEINPQKLVLISTVDVYWKPVDVDETVPVLSGAADAGNNVHPYGLNRYYLESWVRKNYPDALIIRLPGLYGLNIKKNFIYDFLNIIPVVLKEEKYKELCALEDPQDDILIRDCYEEWISGLYKCVCLTGEKRIHLREKFIRSGFTALNFTDSRSTFQFYPLTRLWEDLQTALDYGITLLNLATEPVSAAELYRELTGDFFENEIPGVPKQYDFRTIHAEKFGGKSGYISDKAEVLEDIKLFVKNYNAK